MFCDGCGAAVQVGQKFCPSCGRQLSMSLVSPPPQGRVERHLHLLGVLWMAASAIHLMGAGVLYILGRTLMFNIGQMAGPPTGPGFFQGLFVVLAGYMLLKSIAGFLAGWGLLQREPWARTLTLVLGFLELLHVPLGTALGIYTLWVLLAPNADEEYHRLGRARAA